MSIAKPFTFVAGQKARANEVNADFDTLYSQVNVNIADIAQINRDVDNIESNKADINGNSTQRFAVANPVNSTDAVNKQTLNKSLTNVLDFINGLTIEKDSGSPNDTILVNPGSCYDSTKQVILELSNITSKQNINQGASTTYYVYIIGNETGTSIDIVISNSSVEPTLPTGYTKFRNIGNFTTDSDNNINNINSYSNTFSNSKSEILTWFMPDWPKRIVISSGYVVNNFGWVSWFVRSSGLYASNFAINGVNVAIAHNTYGDRVGGGSAFVPVCAGDIITFDRVTTAHFIPCKGV